MQREADRLTWAANQREAALRREMAAEIAAAVAKATAGLSALQAPGLPPITPVRRMAGPRAASTPAAAAAAAVAQEEVEEEADDDDDEDDEDEDEDEDLDEDEEEEEEATLGRTGAEASTSAAAKAKTANKRDPMLPPSSFWLDEGGSAPEAMGQIAGSHLKFAGE